MKVDWGELRMRPMQPTVRGDPLHPLYPKSEGLHYKSLSERAFGPVSTTYDIIKCGSNPNAKRPSNDR